MRPEEASPKSEAPATIWTEVHRLVNLVLRYIAAGGSALLAFGAIRGNLDFLRSGPPPAEISGWLVLLFVAVLGTAIYAIHSAILYRAIIWGVYSLHPLRLSDIDLVRDLRHRHRVTQPPHPWTNSFDTWAAEVHFLFCSAWGTFAAIGVTYALDTPWRPANTACVVIGAVLFISGVVHNYYLSRKVLEILPRET
jgi:hypothetical protein